ncbi:MAG: hypothetical protein JNL83_17575 [Myxococcales bacterium]|nr:hypothetical protein [Myxococcales bacterium]
MSAVLTLVIVAVACLPADVRAAPVRRAMYVQNAGALLATPATRDRLNAWIVRRRITDVIPYGLGPVLGTVADRARTAAWIDELHRHGARVIAPIAGHDRLRAVDQMLAENPRTWLDGLVTELEFWNRPDRAIAFEELVALIADMRIQAALWLHGGKAMPVGAYLGYPTQTEAVRVAAAIDFAYLDYSVRSPAGAWAHVHATGGPLRQRFAWLAAAGVELWPIFYATGEVDMATALRGRGTSAAEAQFRADLAADPELGKSGVTGFVYFTFEAMPEPR